MAGPLLWGPSLSNNLQSGIQFNGGASIQSGTINPAVTATAGSPGSIYQNTSTGQIFVKQDSGTTTNWSLGVTISGLPTVQVLTASSGTYTPTSSSVLWARVRAVGGGGGGASNSSDGSAGGNTTLGSFLTAGGGGGANHSSGVPGSGGTVSLTVGSGIIPVATLTGASGGPYNAINTSNVSGSISVGGGGGGSSPFGGAGAGGGQTGATAGVANTGSGGGGQQGVSGNNPQAGGGAGGYAEFIWTNPSTQSYTVGAGGAGTSGGAYGGSGVIIIEEFYPTTSNGGNIVANDDVGSIIASGASSAPQGTLLADGSAISRTTYAALFAKIGTTFGVGDGSTTFNLPNLQGVFLRGQGTQSISGVSYSATAGASQNDQFQGHLHTTSNVWGNQSAGANVTGGGGQFITGPASYNSSYPISDGVDGAVRYGAETRPANVGVYYYIRYTATGYSTVGGLTRSISSVSTATNAGAAANTDYVYFVSGTTTLTLPTAVSNTNRYTIKNTGVAIVSVATTSSQTIDGSASPIQLKVTNTSLDLISDGSNWRIV